MDKPQEYNVKKKLKAHRREAKAQFDSSYVKFRN